jgi:hypothetical protein
VKSRLRPRLTFANVVSMAALFVALGGTGYAAIVLPANSVGTPQLKKDSVTAAKVKDGTLKATDFASGQLKKGNTGARGPAGAVGPAGPIGPPGSIDAALYYSKVQSDARYLHVALVTASSGTVSVAANVYNDAVATCPAGYQAIAGGVDTESGQNLVVAASSPRVGGQRALSLAAGNFGPPTGWSGFVRNNGVSTQSFTVVAICAPIS